MITAITSQDRAINAQIAEDKAKVVTKIKKALAMPTKLPEALYLCRMYRDSIELEDVLLGLYVADAIRSRERLYNSRVKACLDVISDNGSVGNSLSNPAYNEALAPTTDPNPTTCNTCTLAPIPSINRLVTSVYS